VNGLLNAGSCSRSAGDKQQPGAGLNTFRRATEHWYQLTAGAQARRDLHQRDFVLQGEMQNRRATLAFVGASSLAMVVNEDVGCLGPRGVLAFFASRLAPTGGCGESGCFEAQKQNPYLHTQIGVSEFNLDDDLLSHGETPHYHRRCIVSLLSSGWDQVVPTLYGRQEIRVLSRDQLVSLQQIGYVTARCFVRYELSVHFVFTHRNLMLFRVVKLLGCYMVKPHGQLVLVSSTPHSAYTPNLSTS
jgi:hypothetical protein